MSLLSKLKQRLGIQVEVKPRETPAGIEPIHKLSFSIGDSLGDIKVAVMHLKTQLERIEGSMLSRDYFDHSMDRRDKSDLVIGKLDETLRVLAEFHPRKSGIEPSKPSLDEKDGYRTDRIAPSLRLQQVLDVFKNRQRTTPKQLAQVLGIATNTACEHLRKLERLGLIGRVSRGLYERRHETLPGRLKEDLLPNDRVL
jgi:ribosomal protein S25